MSRINPYSKKFMDSELQKVRDSVIFVALADDEYAYDLFIDEHYIRRQANLAIELKKPVFLALEKRLSVMTKRKVRSFFPKIDKEIEYDRTSVSHREMIMEHIEQLLQALFPEDEQPKGNPTDAFNDPMHGLERIG